MARKSKTLGIGDQPVTGETGNQDQLGIGGYAKALSGFVRACDTPLTIGIQGDWGSGKTSLMNLVRAQLPEQVPTVWINTWKYAQLGDPETLFLAVLEGVVDGLEARIQGDAETSRVRGWLTKALKVGTVVGKAAAQTQGVDVDGLLDPGLKPHRIADALKTGLSTLVAGAAGDDRVVLFVDDLDRIPPGRAVQILEALKNFLDVPGLVTLLACDYAVISRGLGDRLGVTEADIGRSFFDKIIQVPFRMPVHAYKADSYVQQLLKRVGVRVNEEELELVTKVLRTSVGLNPRSLKRHANTLLLLLKVAEQESGLKKTVSDGRRPLILLALTAMEDKFPGLHRYLARLVRDSDREGDVRALLMELKLVDSSPPPWVAGYWNKDGQIERGVGQFLEALRELVDVNGNQELDSAEIQTLGEMMLLSSISSVGEGADEPPRKGKTNRTTLLNDLPEELRTWAANLLDTVERESTAVVSYGSRGCSIRAVPPDGKRRTLLYFFPPGAHGETTTRLWPYLGELPPEGRNEVQLRYEEAAELKKSGDYTLQFVVEPKCVREADAILAIALSLARELAVPPPAV